MDDILEISYQKGCKEHLPL